MYMDDWFFLRHQAGNVHWLVVFTCKQDGKFPSLISGFSCTCAWFFPIPFCGKALKIQCFLYWEYSDNGPLCWNEGVGRNVRMRGES